MSLDFLNRAAGRTVRFFCNLGDEPICRLWLLMGLASFCLGLTFVLTLFTTLSLPIIQDIYLVEIEIPHNISASNVRATDVVRLGLWGFCQNQFKYVA